MSLENLFKYKEPLYFYFREQTFEGGLYNNVGYHYGGKLIKDGSKVGINNPDDLYNKLSPFIRYLISKMRYELNIPFCVTFNIYICCYSVDFQDFVKVIHFELNHNFTFDGILLLQNLCRYDDRLFKVPFTIHVKANFYFEPDVRGADEVFYWSDSEEDESEDEVEKKPEPIQGHFKTDQCVICMEKEPCILFILCRHICVCLSCETAKPSLKCPCCRSKIYQNISMFY